MTLTYDPSMTGVGKVRRTLTLDPDVVEAFGEDPASLSAAVNAVLRLEMERRQRRAALAAFVDDLAARYGEPDPEQVAYFERLLRQ